MSAAPATVANWPSCIPAPLDLLSWLDGQVRSSKDGAELRILAGFRWLVLAEIDRTAPEPPPKPPDPIPYTPTAS